MKCTESDKQAEEEENVTAHKSSQEFARKNRGLNFLFMAPNPRNEVELRYSLV